MLAEVNAQLLAKGGDHPSDWLGDRVGLYHLAGSGIANRFEWAQEILKLDPKRAEQIFDQLVPARTEEFPTPARRPLHSALNCDLFTKVFGLQLPAWDDALKLAMEIN